MNLITDKAFQSILNKPNELMSEHDIELSTDGRFSFIVQFPDFSVSFISPEIRTLLGYENKDLSRLSILKLIHPADFKTVSTSYKNAYEFVSNNYSALQEGALIFTLQFRLKNINGDYVTFFTTNQLDQVHPAKCSFRLRSTCKVSTSKNYVSDFQHRLQPLKKNGEFLHQVYTKRELQIIRLLALGKNSLEIGSELRISKHTVDTHRRKMLAKTNYSNTAELIANSVSQGLIAG